MNGNPLYSVSGYCEFKMRLQLMGAENIPSERIFNAVFFDDWKWEIFSNRVLQLVVNGMTDLGSVNHLVGIK